MTWTLKQLQEAVNGEVLNISSAAESIRFAQVVTDSRQVTTQDCYVALQGAQFDGHDFIEQAALQGASVVLVAKPPKTPIPAVLVADTRIALGLFAAWHRQNCPLKALFAVTGSNGKTTCKTMLQSVLSHLANTLATPGNLNNDYGVPRTLLSIEPTHEYAVIEMGANHPGEIRYLTQLAQPNIALITQATEAHLEGFGSLQGVIDTKGEVFEGLSSNGVAIINLDSAGSADWLGRCAHLGHAVLTFGRHPHADVRLLAVEQTQTHLQVTLRLPDDQQVPFNLAVLGPHNAMNAAGVIAACWAAGLKWPQILPGLVSFRPVSGRLMTFALSNGWLIDDSYNANPTSVKAGIDTLLGLNGFQVACLGSMAELGAQSLAAHQSVLDYALATGLKQVLVMGPGYQACQWTDARVSWFASDEAMIQAVQALIDQTQEQPLHILVKGSRSAGMEVVSQAIISSNKKRQTS